MIKLEGNKLTIVVELGAGTISKSGKSTILATTSGFVKVDGNPDVQVSYNVIKIRR